MSDAKLVCLVWLVWLVCLVAVVRGKVPKVSACISHRTLLNSFRCHIVPLARLPHLISKQINGSQMVLVRRKVKPWRGMAWTTFVCFCRLTMLSVLSSSPVALKAPLLCAQSNIPSWKSSWGGEGFWGGVCRHPIETGSPLPTSIFLRFPCHFPKSLPLN